MLYILDQRLTAQNIGDEKGSRVLTDVVLTMLSRSFLEGLLQPQAMYTDSATKDVFRKLAHSSIMCLNESSMDKLYELMFMGVKYQVVAASEPQHILHITLTHLESVKGLNISDDAQKAVEHAMDLVVKCYASLGPGDWLEVRQQLLEFLQARRVRVSVLLQHNVQDPTEGVIRIPPHRFSPVPPRGGYLPGIVMVHSSTEPHQAHMVSLAYPLPIEWEPPPDLWLPGGNCLGANIYAKDYDSALAPVTKGACCNCRPHAEDLLDKAWKEAKARASAVDASFFRAQEKESRAQSEDRAVAGVNFLAMLMGSAVKETESASAVGQGGAPPKFHIDLLDAADADDHDRYGDSKAEAKSGGMVRLNAREGHKGKADFMKDLDLGEDEKEEPYSGGSRGERQEQEEEGGDSDDDLLALMDFTSK
jgi:hypothetical protein